MLSANRILILRGGALGDLILTFPLFRALREARPKAWIELAAYAPQGRLALAAGLADSLRSLDNAEFAALFSAHAAAADDGAWLRSFDLVVSFLHDPSGVVEKRLRRSCRGSVICRSPLVQTGHAADHFLAVASDIGLRPSLRYPRITIPASESGQRQTIMLHPGSGSPRKNWPLEHFIALAEQIAMVGLGMPAWFTGEAEDAQRGLLERMNTRFRILDRMELFEAARYLAGCRAYVGNDSGATHLAAALGIPVVAVFGTTDPAMWGPRGPNVTVVRACQPAAGGLADRGPDEVLAALAAAITG